MDILKSKIGATSSSGEAVISIRFTYALSEWPHTLWSQQPPDFDALLSDIGFSELGKLPFGALSDPVRYFVTTLLNNNENNIHFNNKLTTVVISIDKYHM